MRWSVGIEAETDRVLTREQVVELADAEAGLPAAPVARTEAISEDEEPFG